MKIIKALLLLISFVGYGQNSIQGTITDLDNNSMPFVNLVLHAKNHSIPKGTTTDNKGHYFLKNIPNGTYTLKVSYVGFIEFTKQLTVSSNINMGIISLKEDLKSLNQVTIKSKKPIIQQRADKLIFTVENSILSDQNTWEIIKNTPGIFVMQNTITVRSSSDILVYIDNKKVQLSAEDLKNYLENTDGNNIKAIEVITNPSAKYNAEGNAVINIVTKTNSLNGYKGSLSISHTQSEFSKQNFSTSHFYKNNSIDLYVNYNTNRTKKLVKIHDNINYFDSNTNLIKSTLLSDLDIITKQRPHNLLINLDIILNQKNKLSFNTSHYLLPKEKETNTTKGEVLNSNMVLDSTFIAINLAKKDILNNSYYLDFNHKLKREGETFTASLQYSFYDSKRYQDVNTDYFFSNGNFNRNNNFNSTSDQNIEIYTGKLDYVLPITKKSKFSTGFMLSNIASKSDFKQYQNVAGTLELDLSKSNLFLYDERNYAIYSEYENEWKTWYLNIGLRLENTVSKGNSITTSELNKSDYTKLFPSISTEYFPNDNHLFSFTLGKRINRPKYGQLNPFQFFFTDYSANVGNPNLKPAISHNFRLGYSYKSKYNFGVYYNTQKDKSAELSFQDNATNIIKYIVVNIDKTATLGFDFNTSLNITDRWSLLTNAILFYKNNDVIALESANEIIHNNIWAAFGQITNNFSLLKDKSLKSSIVFSYVTPQINGSYKYDRITHTDINFQKKIWKNKAVLTLRFNDIFNIQRLKLTTKYLNQDNFYLQKNETSYVKLGFRYYFGNHKLKANNKEKNSKEKDRLD
jgi:outer membrane receptor protein involved in Fe transport